MPQPQPNTGFGQGNGNTGGILGALLDLAVPNASANTQKQADTINQQVSTINPITGLHDDQAKALQSVLAAQDKQHAQEAVNTQGADAMRKLLDYHYATSPSEEQNTGINKTTPESTSNNIPNQLTPIQQQAMKIIAPATTPVGKFLESLGIGNATKRYELGTLEKAQKVIAGQPAEIALPEAQVGLLKSQRKQIQQQIAGLTPEQQAAAIGNYNTALITQHNDLQKSITDQITSTSTAIDQLVKNTPLLDKHPGSPYYETLRQLQTRLQGLTNQGKDVVQSFEKLQLKNPNQKSNEGIQQFNVGGVTYNIPANKVSAFKKAKGL